MTKIIIKIIAYTIVLVWLVRTKARDIYWYFKRVQKIDVFEINSGAVVEIPASTAWAENQPYLPYYSNPIQEQCSQMSGIRLLGEMAMSAYAAAGANGIRSAAMQAQAAQASQQRQAAMAAQRDYSRVAWTESELRAQQGLGQQGYKNLLG